MKLKIVNKKKLIVRIIEIAIIIGTIIVTALAIKYAAQARGHKAYGGEYLIPIIGAIIIMIIEDAYQESEKNKKGKKHEKK